MKSILPLLTLTASLSLPSLSGTSACDYHKQKAAREKAEQISSAEHGSPQAAQSTQPVDGKNGSRNELAFEGKNGNPSPSSGREFGPTPHSAQEPWLTG